MIATASRRSTYAISVFEVHGGSQHDQFFHAAPGREETWILPGPVAPVPRSLLPASITFLPEARADTGRWFVQSYGEFRPLAQTSLAVPGMVDLALPPSPGASSSRRDGAATVRLHLLGDTSVTLIAAESPDPTRAGQAGRKAGAEPWRSSLIVRRAGAQGASLKSCFVTLFEPAGAGIEPLRGVGRVSTPPDVVALRVETGDGLEYVMINLEPGTTRRVALPGGRFVSFDGLAVRVREDELALAGGTFAEGSGRVVWQAPVAGTITSGVRAPGPHSLGWFVTPEKLHDDPSLAGRTLIIDHADGTSRAWTLDTIEPVPGGTRLHVREEPGFLISPRDTEAHYYQFPRVTAAGPHRFRIARMTR